MNRFLCVGVTALAVCLAAVGSVDAIEWVTVGNPGNAPDTRYDATGFGSVAETYRISKYEVTNREWIDFLTAVATVSDPNGLYNTDMAGTYGGIDRAGTGPYTYSAKGGDTAWLDRPVNWVSWYNTLRYANWLDNGQPTGVQDATTTEDGAYDMSLGASVVRKPGADFFLPTEDEWYKAAYYDAVAALYYDYPTGSNTAPTAEMPPGTDFTNGSANCNDGGFVDPTYYSTPVGAYTAMPSDSPYGTFDQGGNLWEWNETLISGSYRGVRGGSWYFGSSYLHASARYGYVPTSGGAYVGFRVASPSTLLFVPEPSAVLMLVTGLLWFLVGKRRRRGT